MPYFGSLQPYSTWIALVFLICVVTCYGYPVFLPGRWAIDTFFTCYLIVLVAPLLFFGWKLFKKTKFVKPLEADLVRQKPVIDAYEDSYSEPELGFWQETGHMFLCGRNTKKNRSTA
jgi:amino acid transporter